MEKTANVLKAWIAYGGAYFFSIFSDRALPDYWPTPEVMTAIITLLKAMSFIVAMVYTVMKIVFEIWDRFGKPRKPKQ